MTELIKSINSKVIIEESLHGQQAIDMIYEINHPVLIISKSSYDIIFMDLHMPVLGGFDVRYIHPLIGLDNKDLERDGVQK